MAFVIQRNKTWYAVFMNKDGKETRKSTKIKVGEGKRAEKKSKEEAMKLADLMEKQTLGNISLQNSIAILTSLASTQGTATTYVDFYNGYTPKGKPQNQSNAKRALDMFMKFLGADAKLPLDTIKKKHVEDFCTKELERVGTGTVIAYKKHIAAFFNAAIQDEKMLRNPCNGVKVITMGKSQGNDIMQRLPFTVEEMKLILDKFPPLWVDMVKICIWTGGQRMGDVACMRWDQVNFDEKIITIRTMKTGKIVTNPLCDDFRIRLEEIKKTQSKKEIYILPEMARKYQKDNGNLSSIFTNLLKSYNIIEVNKNKKLKGDRKEVSPKSFHSIRHFIVTTLRSSNNVSMDVARSIVGHECEEVERLYSNPSTDTKIKAMQVVLDVIK